MPYHIGQLNSPNRPSLEQSTLESKEGWRRAFADPDMCVRRFLAHQRCDYASDAANFHLYDEAGSDTRGSARREGVLATWRYQQLHNTWLRSGRDHRDYGLRRIGFDVFYQR